MVKKLLNRQEGIAHLGLIILFVAVIGVIGFAGFRIYQNNTDQEEATELVEVDTASTFADVAEEEGQTQIDETANLTEENDAY